MVLSNEDVLILLERARDPELWDAEFHEKRLRMHSEVTIRTPYTNSAYNDFIANYPEKLLPKEKATKFKDLVTAPLPTVDEVQTAYNELTKVFQAQNRVEDFFFEDDTLQADWLDYRERIGEINWWRKQGWNVLQNQVNAVVVIDLPTIQISDAPEPFFFIVTIDKVQQILNTRDGICEYLIYKIYVPDPDPEKNPIEKHIVIDDATYRVYVRAADNDPEFVLELEEAHGLGYVPAKQFWGKPLADSSILKENPISPSVGNLDWMLYSMISKRHLDLYAGFPITSLYEQVCTYQTDDGYACQDGFIHREDVRSNEQGVRIQREPCPVCSNKAFAGPGSTITVPAPKDNEDADNMPGVHVTQGDVNSLKEMKEDVDRQIKNFMETTVGFGGEAANEQAKNQKQIQSNFETRESILQEISNNFSVIQKFTLDTMARLRYGEQYHGSILNYGTKFFLMSIDDMLLTYKSSKDTGMPASDLLQQRTAIYAKKFANDPMQLTRISMLVELEPLEAYTTAELLTLNLFVDPTDMALKINFDDLIQRFEREFGKVQMYLFGLPMEIRLAKIDTTLRGYAKGKDLLLKEPEVEPKQIENG